MAGQETGSSEPLRKVGRKRDSSRDTHLLAAAMEIMSEVGYDRMTMDMVAERAGAGKATAYRRWASKADMVKEAIRSTTLNHVDLDNLPDTGSLRGDILALYELHSIEEAERIFKTMASIASLISQGILGREQSESIVDPWGAAHDLLIKRAVGRAEIPDQPDTSSMARIIPALVIHRVMIARKVADLPFLTMIVDDVLLPALHAKKGNASG
jgi:AcrR family transcriptional regulator